MGPRLNWVRFYRINSFCLLCILIFVFFPLTKIDGHNYARKFKLHRNDTKKVGGGRVLKAIKKLTHLDPIPEIPEVPTQKPKQIIGELSDEQFQFDACAVADLCLNGGECVSHKNDYFCNCPNTHYGKTCEFKADLTKCRNHRCANNATCYSSAERRLVPNPDVNPDSKEMSITISIGYECWCRYGFYGAFCEFSEAMRHCVEDRCNHHGILVAAEGEDVAHCKCRCEKFYSGEECEMVSPCRDLDCINNGTCVLGNDETAHCECPTAVELLPATVKGSQCELVEIPDQKMFDECVPCQGNFTRYLACLTDRQSSLLSFQDLNAWFSICDVSEAECRVRLMSAECQNKGTCQVAVGELPLPGGHALSRKLFLLPKCECNDQFEGNFCERRIPNECDVDKNGAGEESMCVRGQCTFNREDGVHCLCNEGYRGARCAVKDPCVPNPCIDNATCVEFPISETMSDMELKHTCICRISQSVNAKDHSCQTEHHGVCFDVNGLPRCANDANCYPCSMDTVDLLALCNEAERHSGFRCLCPPGFRPPLCQVEMDACDFHQCLNGAICETKKNGSLDYRCKCRSGYEGTFCHIYKGICNEKGDSACGKNGKCVADRNTHRGFRCECYSLSQMGIDCEIDASRSFVGAVKDNFEWTFPLLTLMVISVFFGVVGLRKTTKNDTIIEGRKTDRRELQPMNVG